MTTAHLTPDVWPGQHHELGAVADASGTNFAVWAPAATSVDLCLFDAAGHEAVVGLRAHTAGIWHAYLPGVAPGQRYGYRVGGPWDPERGHLFSRDKLLLDPYARAIDGEVTPHESLAVLTPGGDRNRGDSAAYTPRSIVTAAADFDWAGDARPAVPWERTVVYEAHVRGLTQRHHDVPQQLRGTYAGLAHPAVTDYLTGLGVTSVELLPVHHFASEPGLVDRGLVNYWGYNSIGFFAPHGAYSSQGTGGEQVTEFKQMVRSLHAAGLEVILDVVYNHTAESGRAGPTLAFRGYDDGAYYRGGDRGAYADVTGCGNTLWVSEPHTLRLVMDSLRYWVSEMHVDGFRFDLAPALLRNGSRVDLRAPFLTAVHQDPVLRGVKLIAEPWDATAEGYLVGRFPAPWREWNDKYRDCVRDFWRGQSGGVHDLASRLSGSSDLYGGDERRQFSSVNFVTAHDGFTLRDLVSYNVKHNDANGEGGRDGTNDNRSWNCGIEGDTDDPAVLGLRRRQAANLLATMLLSAGIPMITAGDERGRTQHGNNNAFCQDNDVSWIQWETDPSWAHLLELTRTLLRLRAEHPVLSRLQYFAGRPRDETGRRKDITWLQASGEEMTPDAWHDRSRTTLGAFLAGDQLWTVDRRGTRHHDTSYLVWLHCGSDPLEARLPFDLADHYVAVLDTDTVTGSRPLTEPPADGTWKAGASYLLAAHSFALLEAKGDPLTP